MRAAFIAARALVFSAAFMGTWVWVVLRLQPLSRDWDVSLPGWITAPGVVLGLTGKNVFARLLAGNVPVELIKNTKIPVLLFPPDFKGSI